MSKATYVYCLITSQRPPASAHGTRGLPGTGQVRFLPIESSDGLRRKSRLKKWLAVADAPLADYGEAAINGKLNDLDWVSRRALAHEAVVESMMNAVAILPMKLFTIFTSDERAVGHVKRDLARIDAILERVAGRQEWGVRVVLAPGPGQTVRTVERRVASGSGYLAAKKAAREARTERAARAERIVASLYNRLAKLGDAATRRSAVEDLADGGPLLLDAAFLVPHRRRSRFKTTLRREAQRLQEQGYGLTVSGPWPPYSFVER
jgi:Gas vesicle synthesis protein GvpL/GvpF